MADRAVCGQHGNTWEVCLTPQGEVRVVSRQVSILLLCKPGMTVRGDNREKNMRREADQQYEQTTWQMA
jgi:hypothetical protein